MLITLAVVITSLCICVPKHHVVMFKYMQFYLKIYKKEIREKQIRFSSQIHKNHPYIEYQVLQLFLISSRTQAMKQMRKQSGPDQLEFFPRSCLSQLTCAAWPRITMRPGRRILGVP